MKNLLPFLLLAATLSLSTLARATDNYEYGPNEYVTVAQGLSPDGKYAITTHGEGDLGYDYFHVYLTDARTGQKVGPLEEIKDVLDTGAGAYAARWTPDSSAVTIIWRVSRQAPVFSITYRVQNRRAIPQTKAPVDGEKFGDYWSKNCSDDRPTPRRFGAAKKGGQNH